MSFLSFWDKHPSDFEVIDPKSMTIPDQSLSVRDIIQRFTRGQMEIPPVDSGSDDTFDTVVPSDFDDMVDAHQAVVNGSELYDDLITRYNEKTSSSAPPSESLEDIQ